MARHSGKNLKVLHGANEIDGCVGFDIEETTGTVDLTAAGDAWKSHDTTQSEWSGTINMKLDHEAVANQTLRAGDSLTIQGYTEGDASGMTYLEGLVSIVSHKAGTSHDGEATREYTIMGNGALTITTVA